MMDFRSDTATKPSKKMRAVMASAEVGDDHLREDPTVRELEDYAALQTGKEAALFVPSGTFANQLAIFTWIKDGGEIYVNEQSHIIQHEAGASAYISRAFARSIPPSGGHGLRWEEDIAHRIRLERDQHFPVSALICLENALSDGTVQTVADMEQIKQNAEKYKLPVHLDGARLFNAAVSLNVEASEIAKHTDSLMFCLSKGLGAPVGSVLCGSRDFVEEAFLKRKIMGGTLRQAGILAAAGLIGLKEERLRLKDDHEHARQLAEEFSRFPEIFDVLTPRPEINMVFLKLKLNNEEADQRLMTLLEEKDILTYPPENRIFRFVTHRDLTAENISAFIRALPQIADALSRESA